MVPLVRAPADEPWSARASQNVYTTGVELVVLRLLSLNPDYIAPLQRGYGIPLVVVHDLRLVVDANRALLAILRADVQPAAVGVDLLDLDVHLLLLLLPLASRSAQNAAQDVADRTQIAAAGKQNERRCGC
ncbi:MAG: hypothetical protein M3403_04960 [Gemmatimonadota bacterium]|nr:hypothetical protein [Gemmatimonadota bacterium]